MIQITGNIRIDDTDILKRFIRASGPGGQHVNKASTAVQIRYDVQMASTLPKDVKKRAIVFAGKQATTNLFSPTDVLTCCTGDTSTP